MGDCQNSKQLLSRCVPALVSLLRQKPWDLDIDLTLIEAHETSSTTTEPNWEPATGDGNHPAGYIDFIEAYLSHVSASLQMNLLHDPTSSRA